MEVHGRACHSDWVGRGEAAFNSGFPEGPALKLERDKEILPYFIFSIELKDPVDAAGT